MENTIVNELLNFISASPSAFHAAENSAKLLNAAGYTELYEHENWVLSAPGKYFVRRNDSALIAFRLPKSDFAGFMMMAAHSDSPNFKIKEEPAVTAAGMYKQLNVEMYGGAICSSWLDRPLSVAGRVVLREDGRIVSRLVNIERNLLLIPNAAIHMDRRVNDGKAFNVNVDMLPLAGSASGEKTLKAIVAEALGTAEENIISSELNLYPRTAGTIWGFENEFVSSPRIDDLQCAFACLKGFAEAKDGESAALLCLFDNEEVGSGTKQGADSTFLSDVLQRICAAVGREQDYPALLAQSFMVSADNAHAVHPNHPEYADRNDRPEMNKGIVIKYNANQKYTTDALSAAVFSEICAAAGVPVQRFTNRADMPGGSTLGNISLAHVSVSSVDIGLAQLAMHSAYETAGVKDADYLAAAAREFYSRSLKRSRQGVEI